jgi:hypothetical protein
MRKGRLRERLFKRLVGGGVDNRKYGLGTARGGNILAAPSKIRGEKLILSRSEV